MRPLALRMAAFGPFPGEERIDFRPALGAGFVLIHGRTGAGKSTILDAICHALYGSTATDGRPVDRMRSHLADAAVPTELTLDFELRGAPYRVHRRPPFERPRQRGEGTTTAPGQATLWDRSGCTTDTEEGRPLASGDTRVTEAVQRLLGFSVDQFRQVILLPQGKVREFLVAGSLDREEVLKVLFGTQRFENLAGALKSRRIELTRAVELARGSGSSVLATVGMGSREELVQAGKSLADEERELAESARLLREEASSAGEALAHAEAVAKKFQECADAEEGFRAAQEALKAVAVLEQELSRARAALPVATTASLAALKSVEHARAVEAAKEAQREVEGAAEALESGRKALEEARARAARRDELAAEATRLEGLIPTAESLAAAGLRRVGIRSSLDTAQKSIELTEQELGTVQTEAERVAGQVARLADEASQLAPCQAELERTRAWRGLLAGIATAIESEADAGRKREEAAWAQARAATALSAAVDSLELVRARWAHGRAAALAASLQEGAPCPVCGSRSHPAPARPEPSGASDAELEKAESALRNAAEREAAARAELARCEEGWAASIERRKTLEARLRDEHQRLPSGDPEAAESAAEAALARAREAGEELIRQRNAGEELRKRISGLQAEHGAARVERERLSVELAGVESEIRTLSGQLPEGAGDAGSMSERARAAREEVRRMDADVAAATAEVERTTLLHSAACAKQQSASEVLRLALAEADRTAEEFRAALAEAGFANEDEYRAAHRDTEFLRSGEQRLAAAREREAAARDRLSRAKAAIQGLQVPDLEAARRNATEARERSTRAETNLGAARERLGALRRVAAQVAKHADAEAAAQRELDAIGPLALAVDGRPPNQTGINLQRWILGAMFDDVLVDATVRLRELSRGRYRLHRATERRHRGQAFGLELEVEDAWTGLSRPVATLSGGESFQAALALALGLADSVQRQAGGIEMGALFIDEGFGSLDRESLDDAIDLLRGLRMGNRLVGIVSHVAELQGLIDTRLEVVAGTRGSSTRWHTP